MKLLKAAFSFFSAFKQLFNLLTAVTHEVLEGKKVLSMLHGPTGQHRYPFL